MSALIAIGKAIAAALTVAAEVARNLFTWFTSPSGQQAVEIVVGIFSMADALFDLLEESFSNLRTRKVVASWPQQ